MVFDLCASKFDTVVELKNNVQASVAVNNDYACGFNNKASYMNVEGLDIEATYELVIRGSFKSGTLKYAGGTYDIKITCHSNTFTPLILGLKLEN